MKRTLQLFVPLVHLLSARNMNLARVRSWFLLIAALFLGQSSEVKATLNYSLPAAPNNIADAFVRVTYGTPVQAGLGISPEYSLFTIDILASPVPPIAPIRYAGWCFDLSTSINPGGPEFPGHPGTTYGGALYSSLDPTLNTHLPNHPGVMQGPATWNKVNWIINNRRLPLPCAGGVVPTMIEVQRAIWALFGQTNTADYDVISYRPQVVQCIIDAATAADTAGWAPKCGDKIAVIYNIDVNWDDLVPDVQLLFLEVPTPTPTVSATSDVVCEGLTGHLTATASGTDGTWSWTGPGGFTANTQSIDVTVPGTYTVSVKNVFGCTQNSTATFAFKTTDCALVTVGDFIWNDLNENGIQDAGEPGINGVTVTLTGTMANGVPVTLTTTTSGNGGYLFTLPTGTYSVTVDASNFAAGGPLEGFTASPTLVGANRGVDSNPNPSGTTPALLPPGSSDLTIDFGFYQPVTIGNFVWNDLNGNGVQDAGEPGIPGVTLTINGTTGSGVPISQSTTTDANGNYQFTEPPGSYCVTVTAPAGYSASPTGQGTPATDSNTNPGCTTPATLAGGSTDQTIDFGFYQPVTIGNFVWNDLNANGIQDVGEPGIPGVTLTLTGTTGVGASITQTTTTDANGLYQFTEPPGTYSVAVTAPAGYLVSPTGQGTLATDSNPTPSGTTPATLASGGSDQTLDFGFYSRPPKLELQKLADQLTVLPGGTVTYTYIVKNTGGVTITNVKVVDDNGTPGDTSDDIQVGTISSLAPGASQTFTYATTLTQDFCMVINGVNTLVGQLYITDLGDRYQVTYVQKNVNDNRYGTGATAATGWPKGQTFSNLTGSDKAEFKFTDANGVVVLDFFIDYISSSSSFISGYGSLGPNGGDGSWVSGDKTKLLSWTTSLSDNLNTTTFKTGYTVNSPPETSPLSGVSVPAGWNYDNSYTVVVSKSAFGTAGFGSVAIPAIHDSPPKMGSANLITPTPCETCVQNIAVASGTAAGNPISAQASATVCFGAPTAAIGDYVWSDDNANGIQDDEEDGVPNVTVQLYTCANVLVATTTTDTNGFYQFIVAPGSYYVKVIPPLGYTFTLQDVGGNTLTSDAVDSDANASGVMACTTLTSGEIDNTWDAGLIPPQVQLVKTADASTAKNGGQMGYTYTISNSGATAMNNLAIIDDAGTPDYPGDDFTVASGITLNPGETKSYHYVVTLPIPLCAGTTSPAPAAGTLWVETLPSGDIKVTLRQSRSLNDNVYGTPAPADGWTAGHTFGNLTGSDKAEFRFTDGTGKVVLDFYCDYVTATNISAAFPSGYACLGPNGGDGSLITGARTNILWWTSTLADNLNRFPGQFTVNSPTPESAYPTWDYVDGFTVIVSKNAFGAAGFGGVTIPDIHNSPAKTGNNQVAPTPCGTCIVNTAQLVALDGSGNITSVLGVDTAEVCTGDPVPPTPPCLITKGALKIDKNTIQLPIKNNGTSAIYLSEVDLTWLQSVNGKLKKVTLNGDVWVGLTGSPASLTSGFTSDPNKRKIDKGQTKTLVLQFEKNASKVLSDYSGGTVKFGSDTSCAITFLP